MNTYNLILDYIDEINDSVVTTESNVIKSLMNSYYKQYELFTECEYLGKDPYKIYQEASIMDEVKEQSKNDKNKLITFLKFIPRLIITIIKKIKNKLFGKKDKKNTTTVSGSSSNKGSVNAGNGSNLFNKDMIEKTRKAASNSKNGKIVLGGGVIVTALASGGLVISKVIKNKGKGKKSGKSKDVKIEITKDNKIKCNFNIKKIKVLQEKLVRLFKRNVDKVNDRKTLNQQEVKQFADCSADLKKEIDDKNDDTVVVVNNIDLEVNDDVVKILEDDNVESALEIINKAIEDSNSKSNGDKQIATSDDSTVLFANSLPEAMSTLDRSVDVLTETDELINKSVNFAENKGSSSEVSGGGKKKNIPDDHANDAVIKDNCEKLTKFYNNALEHLKDIEDVISGNPDINGESIIKNIKTSLQKISDKNVKFNNDRALPLLEDTFYAMDKEFGEFIRNAYNDVVSSGATDKQLSNDARKLLTYFKNISCVDVYMEDIMEIDRRLMNITVFSDRLIPTDYGPNGNCVEIDMRPLKLDLDKLGLSKLHMPKSSLDCVCFIQGLCSKFKVSGDKGDRQQVKKKTNSNDQYSNTVLDGVDFIQLQVDPPQEEGAYEKPPANLEHVLPDESIKGIIATIATVKESIESERYDFDNDVLHPLHVALHDYMYKVIPTKSGNLDRKQIIRTLENFGYEEYEDAKVGDEFSQNIAKYFEKSTPVPTDDENKKGKIFEIKMKPMVWNNDDIEQYFGQRAKREYILKGTCSYYKK